MNRQWLCIFRARGASARVARNWRVLGLALVLGVAAGCSTVHPDAYSSADAPARLAVLETNGLRLSVDVVLDRKRSKKYFGTDTLGKGIVPVFVRVENVSAPGSVLVEKERFNIRINAREQTTAPLAGSVAHDSTSGKVVAGAGTLLLSGPLIIVGASMVSTADEIRHNFAEKELRNQSLPRGRSVEGFVYCEHPARKEPITHVLVSLPLRELPTDRQFQCDLLVNNENPR